MIFGIRVPYWAVSVWLGIIAQTIVTPFFFGQGFDYAVWIATPFISLGLFVSGCFGIAKAVQDRVDTWRFRKQIEKVEVDS